MHQHTHTTLGKYKYNSNNNKTYENEKIVLTCSWLPNNANTYTIEHTTIYKKYNGNALGRYKYNKNDNKTYDNKKSTHLVAMLKCCTMFIVQASAISFAQSSAGTWHSQTLLGVYSQCINRTHAVGSALTSKPHPVQQHR